MKWNPPFRHSAVSFQVCSYVIARSMATKQSHGRVDKKAMRLLLLPGKDRNDTEIRNLSLTFAQRITKNDRLADVGQPTQVRACPELAKG
jgi:hypothetical protein